jgi:hypothetical protein
MGWELRRMEELRGMSYRHRKCMACGAAVDVWWRYLGPRKTSRWSSDRRRVVICVDCGVALGSAKAPLASPAEPAYDGGAGHDDNEDNNQ